MFATYLCIEALAHDAQPHLPALFISKNERCVLELTNFGAYYKDEEGYLYPISDEELERHFVEVSA